MRPRNPQSVMGKRPPSYKGPTRSLRPKNGGLVTVVVDNNQAHRRMLKKALGKSYEIKRREGPEPRTEIDGKPCSQCHQPMGSHIQPEYSCPVPVYV